MVRQAHHDYPEPAEGWFDKLTMIILSLSKDDQLTMLTNSHIRIEKYFICNI